MAYQNCIVEGNIGKIEMRYTQNGKAVTSFSVAVNEKYGDTKTTEWFRCVAWEKLGETINQWFAVGAEILVAGKMKTRSWDGPDGNKRYRTELIVRDFSFVGPSKDRAEQGGDIDPDDLPWESGQS